MQVLKFSLKLIVERLKCNLFKKRIKNVITTIKIKIYNKTKKKKTRKLCLKKSDNALNKNRFSFKK